MIHDYLQFLFYAWPPNSQLLFSEPWIGPFFKRFWRARRASGLRHIKKLDSTKCLCLMVPFKSCFMHDTQIPNFYLANLESGPFMDNFDGPVGPQGCVIWKSCIAPIVNVWWSPSSLVLCTTPNSQLLFCEPGIGSIFGRFWRARLKKKNSLWYRGDS